jgi:uncharacterized protein (DUF433 family)
MSRYALNLPIQLKQEAEALATEQGVSLNQFILWAVSEKVGGLRQRLDDPQHPHITYRRSAQGQPQPVVRGSGIRVQTLVIATRDWGMSSQEVATEYGLTQAQVQDALAFYAAHTQEITAQIAREGEQAQHV